MKVGCSTQASSILIQLTENSIHNVLSKENLVLGSLWPTAFWSTHLQLILYQVAVWKLRSFINGLATSPPPSMFLVPCGIFLSRCLPCLTCAEQHAQHIVPRALCSHWLSDCIPDPNKIHETVRRYFIQGSAVTIKIQVINLSNWTPLRPLPRGIQEASILHYSCKKNLS